MKKQTFTYHFKASPQEVYRAHLDPEMLKQWKSPDEMTMTVHSFESKVGGKFRISLTYNDQSEGKSSEHTDTYHGYFKELKPNEKIVEVMEFESANTELKGEMTITTILTAEKSGTKLESTHENLPSGVPEDQNKEGWQISLGKLDKLLQSQR